MATTVESAWLLAAKCGALSHSDFRRLLPLAAAAAAVLYLLTALLYWAFPGGPAWGRYRLAKGKAAVTRPIPGPRGLPVVGSMGLMQGLAHRKLAATAASLGAKRLMAFSIGETRAVVTAHPDVAKEILSSPAFADRPIKESAYGLLFHRAIGFAPYGAYWRSLRRISSTHLFSPRQIAAGEASRAAIADAMVAAIRRSAAAGGVVTPRVFLKRAALSNMMETVFGKKYVTMDQSETTTTTEVAQLVQEGYDILGMLNWSDHLPGVAALDLQSIRSRCNSLVPRVDRFVRQIIREHRERGAAGGEPEYLVDVLLHLPEGEQLPEDDMVAVLWEMIFRGTDTVATAMEWVLARVVAHREVQARAQDELDRVAGPGGPVTEAQAATELHYLQAVIKETLRVHPPGPLLSWARLATSDVYVDGHLIPAGTTAMVNMWSITHDPEFWADPEAFDPARFGPGGAAQDCSVMGSELRVAPFGSGRRVCPGKALAMTAITFWIAKLLHELDWMPARAGAGAGAGAVDLSSELLRLSCEMAVPLNARVLTRAT